MKLKINKFGPINNSCQIDLDKKMMVFVGKNNSGKTYLSQLIWGIYNFDNQEEKYYIEDYGHFSTIIKKENIDININEIFFDNEYRFSVSINDFLDNFSKNYSKHISQYKVNKIFKKDIESDLSLKFELKDILNIKIDDGVSGRNWSMEYFKEENSNELEITFILDSDIKKEEIDEIPFELINRYLEGAIIEHTLTKQATYLPSTRLFLPSFYRYIYSFEKDIKDKMIEEFEKLNSNNKSFFASSYTLPVDQLMKKLVFELDKFEKNEFLEKISSIIEGDITIDKSEDIAMADLSYIHKKSGEKLPMHLSSSMVNQLVMVYLFFKYWNDNDSLLLLDEPEMNLHPKKKIELIELLLDFASKNQLIIATHSSTMAKTIINYIQLFDLKSKIDDEKLKTMIEENELQLNTNINLSSNDIAIYYFNGDTIIPYKNENESNIQFGTFTQIEELLNKQYEYLMDWLYEYN